MADITEITRSLEARALELRDGAQELERIEAALRHLRGPRSGGGRGRSRDALLDAVRNQPGLTASELARAAGVSSATAHNVLKALVADGELARDDAKRYSVA